MTSRPSGHFELEGLPLEVIETGHTDTVDSTSLYVPDLGLVVSGDVAYNHFGRPTTTVRLEDQKIFPPNGSWCESRNRY